MNCEKFVRYPFRTVAGTPAVQPISIGVSLSSVPPPIVVPSPPANVVAGEMQSLWAFQPRSEAGDENLSIEREGGAAFGATSVPAGAFVGSFNNHIRSITSVAMVTNVPAGADVTWAVSLPTIAVGTGSVTDDGDGNYSVFFGSNLHYIIRVNANKVACAFVYPSGAVSYGAWALNAVTLTPSVEGVPLRTLTITASARAYGGL